MDRIDYAIIGWVDEGRAADPTELAEMLGVSPDDTDQRICVLRVQGRLPHAWCQSFGWQRQINWLNAPLKQQEKRQ